MLASQHGPEGLLYHTVVNQCFVTHCHPNETFRLWLNAFFEVMRAGEL